jgi:GNAT superfamily N-acetyltransferase
MLVIRKATPADLDTVLTLVMDVVRWLAERGTDQWQYPVERHRQSLSRTLARGETWLASDASSTVATITLNDYADPEFWTPADTPDDALYVHRMVVTRDRRGQHIGAALLDWAGRQATHRGKKWLRLDAWSTNPELHAYYHNMGFQHVRTLILPHRGSGALFQRPASDQSGQGPQLIERHAPSPFEPRR